MSEVKVSSPVRALGNRCRVVVIWIDWYAYHVARFRGIALNPQLAGAVRGIELVGGIGVHQGLKFREELPADLPVDTLLPASSWQDAGQFKLALKLWRRLSILDPSVVLVPGYYTLPAIAAAMWAKLNGARSILMTESTAEDHVRVWWKELAKSALINCLFDWAVAGGKAHFRYLQNLHFPSNRVATSYDVVDNQYISSSVDDLRGRPAEAKELDAKYFLYVGRLAPEKNVQGLLEEWHTYRCQGGAWPLVIVGSGPEEQRLRSAAAALPHGTGVSFAGHKAYREILPFYASAGCFVLPSTREPWGLVANEAMAAGLPVLISSRCGCAEDLVDQGVNGFIFDSLEAGSLSTYLHRIEALSYVQWAHMGDRSRRIVSNYTPQLFGNEIARIATG